MKKYLQKQKWLLLLIVAVAIDFNVAYTVGHIVAVERINKINTQIIEKLSEYILVNEKNK